MTIQEAIEEKFEKQREKDIAIKLLPIIEAESLTIDFSQLDSKQYRRHIRTDISRRVKNKIKESDELREGYCFGGMILSWVVGRIIWWIAGYLIELAFNKLFLNKSLHPSEFE